MCLRRALQSLHLHVIQFHLSRNGRTRPVNRHANGGYRHAFLLNRTIHTASPQQHLDNPTVSRYEAAKNLIEAAGGKLISMYSTATDGPGVLVIFGVPDPNVAPAISGVVLSTAPMHNAKLTRLWTPDEITPVRKMASELRGVYKPPGK